MPTIDPNAPPPPPAAPRPEPYVLGVPFEQITAEDWNEIQIRSREELRAHQHNGTDGTPPLARLAIRDKAIDGTKIDPSSDVTIKSLVVDTTVSVVSDVTVGGAVSARSLASTSGLAADLAVNDRALLLRGNADRANALAWRAQFSAAAVDGPVLHGNAGGALGTNAPGGEKIALSWDSAQNVNVRGKLTVTSAETLEPATIGGTLTVKGPDFILDHPARRSAGASSASRRALVHDSSDGLTLNLANDYPGGVTIRGLLSLPEGVRGALSVGGMELNRDGTNQNKLVTDGTLNVSGAGRLNLLHRDGVYVTSTAGGSANLTVQGRLTVGATETFAGNAPRALNVSGELKVFGSNAGLRVEDRTATTDAGSDWLLYAQGASLRVWRQNEARDLLAIDNTGTLTVGAINSKPRVQSFKVDGDFNTYYPIVFRDDNWTDGAVELDISRSNIHTDSSSRGGTIIRLRFHPSNWGHGSEFVDLEHYYNVVVFLGGYGFVATAPEFVVWLRGGGTTYSFRSNHPITLVDSTAQKKNRGYNNAQLLDLKTTPDWYIVTNGRRLPGPLAVPSLSADGAIVPSIGATGDKGIQFPMNAFGGGGDEAFIRYYRPLATGEDTKLLIGNQNDANDSIGFYQYNDERLTIHNGCVGVGTPTPRNKLEVAGDVRLCGNASPIFFTSPTFTGRAAGGSEAEISNDTTNNKTLMLVGNGSAGLGRRVSVWDRLEVNGPLIVNGGMQQAAPDLGIDATARRNGHLGDVRRALVHDANDTLVLNYNGDYRGGTRLDSQLDVSSDIGTWLGDLRLASTNDHNHGIGYYGWFKPFAGIFPEGPVVYGQNGGALGAVQTYQTGTQGGVIFNGTDGYIELPTLDIDFSWGFTVEAWVRWDQFNNWSRIIDFGNGMSADNLVLANDGTTGNLTFHCYSGAQLKNRIDAAGALAVGQWLYIALTIDKNGVAKLYKGTPSQAPTEIASKADFGVPLRTARTKCYIGKSNWNESFFKGGIGVLRVWQRDLSPAEVRDHYTRRRIGRESGLWYSYHFNGADGATQAFDSGPTAKHGTIRGGVSFIAVQSVALRWNGAGNIGIGTNVPQDKLDVKGAVRVGSDKNPIRFTSEFSGFPDAAHNQAEISNDTNIYKTLMIVGNRSNGTRRVGVWDRLEVNGNLAITAGGSLFFNNGTKQSTACRVVVGVQDFGGMSGVASVPKTLTAAQLGLARITSATAGVSALDVANSRNTRVTITATVATDNLSVTLTAICWADTIIYGVSASYTVVGTD